MWEMLPKKTLTLPQKHERYVKLLLSAHRKLNRSSLRGALTDSQTLYVKASRALPEPFMDYPASLEGNQLTLSKSGTVLIYILEIFFLNGTVFQPFLMT